MCKMNDFNKYTQKIMHIIYAMVPTFSWKGYIDIRKWTDPQQWASYTSLLFKVRGVHEVA